MKQVCNSYHHTITKAKNTCWKKFIQRVGKKPQSSNPLIDQNHFCKVSKYTKPLQFNTKPALKHSDEYTAILMKAKEAFVYLSAF